MYRSNALSQRLDRSILGNENTQSKMYEYTGSLVRSCPGFTFGAGQEALSATELDGVRLATDETRGAKGVQSPGPLSHPLSSTSKDPYQTGLEEPPVSSHADLCI